MVKQGSDRAAKSSAKYDPFVIMLRIKALQNSMKDKFQIPAVQQTYVDENVQQWALDMGLSFGKTAVLFDLTRRYVWKIGTMDSTAIEVMHLAFISKGFTETQYITWLEKLYAKLSEITNQYNFCHRETAKLFVDVQYLEPTNTNPQLESAVEWIG
jgi:hypothetical protein